MAKSSYRRRGGHLDLHMLAMFFHVFPFQGTRRSLGDLLWKSPAGNTGCEANEALAILRIETNEHGAAILDVSGTKFHR